MEGGSQAHHPLQDMENGDKRGSLLLKGSKADRVKKRAEVNGVFGCCFKVGSN